MSENVPFSLSVVVPTHGGRASVVDTVSALLAEPSEAMEIIVVSDGDPTAAKEALNPIEDARLRIIDQPKTGSAAARNLGLSEARYDWVAFVDDDDIPCPNWFEVWKTNAHGHVVVTACVKHWQGGEVLAEKRCCSLDPDNPTMGASRLLAGAFASKRSLLMSVGGYDLALKASQNQDLGLRILDHIQREGMKDQVKNTDQVVIEIFTEPSDSRRRRYGTSRADAARLFQVRYSQRLAARAQDAANLHRIIGRSAMDDGRMSEARRSAWAAVRVQPTRWANWRFFLASLAPSLIGRLRALPSD